MTIILFYKNMLKIIKLKTLNLILFFITGIPGIDINVEKAWTITTGSPSINYVIHNIKVSNNAKLTIKANEVLINNWSGDFEVQSGSSLEIR